MRPSSVKDVASHNSSRKKKLFSLLSYGLLSWVVFLGSFYFGLNFVGPKLEQSPQPSQRMPTPSFSKVRGGVEIIELPPQKKTSPPPLGEGRETDRPSKIVSPPPEVKKPAWPSQNPSPGEQPSIAFQEETSSAEKLPPPLEESSPELPKTLWKVQVGAFSSEQNAWDLANRLIREGYPSSVHATETGRGTVYKVQIQETFADKEHAENRAQELEKKGIPAIVIEE